jgi:hypothetical protein
MTTVALQHRTAAASKAGADPVEVGAGPRDTHSSEIGLGEIVEELLSLAGGVGFFAVAFAFPIPGFIAALALVVLAGILVAIPLIAAGIVAAVVGGPVWLAVRLVRGVRARRG